MSFEPKQLVCPLCGQSHAAPKLRPGHRAKCVRCDFVMAEGGRLGPQGVLAFAVAGLAFAIPASLVPLVTLAKFGNERAVILTDGFVGYWSQGFQPFAFAVLFCGTIAPFALLALLAAVILTDEKEPLRDMNRTLRTWAHRVEYWAMPEVQVLGVLVAFFKLGHIVDIGVKPGIFAYAAASLFTLLAWRAFKLDPVEKRSAITRPST
ncbi:MAG: Paraquat-inducible protein [Verrucomicrobia bacterium]|nr:Paraquat-inducible protein [Verrucomicrobiota bacterium]